MQQPMNLTLLDSEQLAALLGVHKATPAQWRHQGVGPRYIYVGRQVRYRLSDVEAWLDRRAQGGEKRRPGRPKGSKNKPKQPADQLAA